MSLGTTGAILSFALDLEQRLGAFYNRYNSVVNDQSLKGTFQSLQKAHAKQERILKRLRRENVTEMILEPIHDFEKEQFELEIPEESHDDSSLLRVAIKLEERSQALFNKASEKMAFLPEVSEQFKMLADRVGNHIKILESSR
ncbi:MAG: hypothetical protein ACP6KW_05500 [Candidatus Thorarchaeota archaeon]